MPSDPFFGDPTSIISMVVVAIIVAVIMLRFYWRFRHGDPETRRKREVALLLQPITVDTPFDMTGVGRAGPLMLYLDIDLSVPWDADPSQDACGVSLEYEVWVDDKHVETCQVSMPAQARNLDVVTTLTINDARTLIRHGCQVDKLHRMREGAKLSVRGVATAKPRNTINEMTIWVA